MKRCKIIFLIITIFFSFIQTMQRALAQNTDELEKREQRSMQLLSEVNNLSESYGRFLFVRDKNLHGENGIQEKYKKCFTYLANWIKDWSLIFATIDLKDKIDSNTMQVQVQNLLSRQVSSSENIKINCEKIKSDADLSIKIIENAPKYDENLLKDYKNILNEAEKMKNKLIQILLNYGAAPLARVQKLDQIIELSKNASISKLKVELLNNARIPLEKTLAEFKIILAVSKISDAALSNVMYYENKMNEYALNLQYFSAKKMLKKSQKECAEKNADLSNSSIDRKYLLSTISRLNTLCKASEEHFSAFKIINSPLYEYVFNFSQLVNANIKLNCTGHSNVVACNKIAVLNSLKKDELKKLSESKLEYIEMQLAEIFEEFKNEG